MKILLIDHHELFREGLCHVLKKMPTRVDQILEAGNFLAGLKQAEQHPDLILLELNTPDCEGALSVNILRRNFPLIPVVVVSSEEDSSVISQALRYGASGYVCKSSSGSLLLGALDMALAGSIYVPIQYLHRNAKSVEEFKRQDDGRNSKNKISGLTSRQRQVLALLSEGRSNKEISVVMQLAEGTIKVHVSSVFQALRVNSRTEAVQVAKQMGVFTRLPEHKGKQYA